MVTTAEAFNSIINMCWLFPSRGLDSEGVHGEILILQFENIKMSQLFSRR